jgi:signal transduction histidine kinase
VAAAGTGHGIVGMRERVLALGGRFTAGPHPEGAFRVSASLPYQTPDLGEERLP